MLKLCRENPEFRDMQDRDEIQAWLGKRFRWPEFADIWYWITWPVRREHQSKKVTAWCLRKYLLIQNHLHQV